MNLEAINEEVFNKFEEILFLEDTKSNLQRLLLFIHAINLSNGLICSGLLEDDPIAEYILPQNWSNPIDNIYSFRYQSQRDKSKSLYFKLIHELPADMLFINAVASLKPDVIFSFEIQKISQFIDFKPRQNASLNGLLTDYYLKILLPLSKVDQKPTENKSTVQEPLIIRPNPGDFFWNRPINTEPSPFRPTFGDYGSSDLRPIPLGGNSGGSLLGPNNPIFLGRNENNNNNNINDPFGGQRPPGARFDPFGPNGINGSFSGFDQGLPKNSGFGGGFGNRFI